MTTTEQRLTVEREAEIRGWIDSIRDNPTSQDQIDLIDTLNELDAVRRERAEARTVTDEMVGRAVWAYERAIAERLDHAGEIRRGDRCDAMRAALTAAMAKDGGA